MEWFNKIRSSCQQKNWKFDNRRISSDLLGAIDSKIKRWNVFIIDWFKYHFDWKHSFIIDKNAKKSAEAQWNNNYKDKIDFLSDPYYRQYKKGENYIPTDNSYVSTVEFLDKLSNSSEEELETMYKEAGGRDDLDFFKELLGNDHVRYIRFLKKQLKKHIDIIDMYEKWDRFVVEKPTYFGKEIFSDSSKDVYCKFVNVRSEKTWVVYRVLSC